MYLVHPVFVYEQHFVTSSKPISKSYIAQKLLKMLICFFVVYVVWKERWVPLIEAMGQTTPFAIYSSFYLPGMVVYNFCFIITFELAANIYAELSGWTDR